MNRVIKFRAWITDLKIMLEDITVYPDMIGVSLDNFESELPDKHELIDDEVYHKDFENDNDIFERVMSVLPGEDWIYIEPENYVLREYTGLKDKNGIEIFEGDILTIESEKPMIVKWNEKFASWCLYRDGWLFAHWFGESCQPEQCVIIGNEFENPELLNAVKN